MTAWPIPRVSVLTKALPVAFGLLAVVLLSEPDLADRTRLALQTLLVIIWCVYIVQLIATIRTRPAEEGRGAILIVDLLAVAVPLAAFLVASDPRDVSLACGVWILKPLRDSTAFRLVAKVLANEARNLIGVVSIFGIVLIVAAVIAYFVERDAQPNSFGSIPKAMWWAVVTLSTTGYGDAIPQSLAGRVLAGLVMMCGIGVFALWAGILASGFAEEVRRLDFVNKWQLVSAVPLFAQLGAPELAGIVRALRPRHVPAGAVICRKGETGDQMFFIVEGRVGVAAAAPVELGPGAFFGEMALITGEPRTATVTAASAVTLLSLHSLDFQILLSHNPAIAETIRSTAAERGSAKLGS
ncbi:cyclic nucleotide-gated ion channel [Mesorhizobium sp. KR9-304]|uniref:cyclic nucleotide-gated ion channel n=1 Tax=Mesorhizobium sp. KR9-304 TaxID=3156614 RepID=UPI0032B4C447